MMNNGAAWGVHYATYRDEDTGETTPLFLYSHSEIDAEIDRRIRSDATAGSKHLGKHEVTRAKFHAALKNAEKAAAA